MSKLIRVVEVGPRDGLQNEKKNITLKTKQELIAKLVKSGLKNIEVGAFVSPKWVPQMAGSTKLIHSVLKKHKSKTLKFSALAPNARGMEDALNTNIKEVAIFGACTESFSQRNINCSIAESFKRFEKVIQLAKKNKIKVRGYLSVAFGCPYEGKVSEQKVIQLVKKMLKLGVYEVSIGDTIGVANPKQVDAFLKKLLKVVPKNKIAMHFHDTQDMALANVYVSLLQGIKTYDASVGGLGGCPYAKGASGNLATEDLVNMLHSMGYKTGVKVSDLVAIRHYMSKKVGRVLPGKVTG